MGANDWDCLDDYSPCICSTWTSAGDTVICLELSAQEVLDVINRTTTPIFSFEWSMLPDENHVPSELLRGRGNLNSSVQLTCSTPSPLTADHRAFGIVKAVKITGCDVSQLNLENLVSFESLESLNFFRSSGIRNLPDTKSIERLQISSSSDFASLAELNAPQLLAGLRYLNIEWSPAFRQWDPSVQWAALESLSFYGSQLGNELVSGILESILATTADTLTLVDLRGNNLTSIPTQIRSFSRLNRVHLAENMIQSVGRGSINFSGPGDYPSFIDLNGNGLETIAPDAFQGTNCPI